MYNLLVVDHGASDLRPKTDYCDQLQKQAWNIPLKLRLYNNKVIFDVDNTTTSAYTKHQYPQRYVIKT